MSNVFILDAFWVDKSPFPSVIDRSSKVGQILYSEYSGTARYLGWMDMIQLKELVYKNHISHIILKNLDILGRMAQVNGHVDVCSFYMKKRFIICKAPNKKDLKGCKPLYRTVEYGGWDFSLDDPDIPERAKYYMQFLLLNTGVSSIIYSTHKVRVTVSICDKNRTKFEIEQLE